MLKNALTAAFAACLFLLIVGAKWATFDRFGSPMPDWDQWDAEALQLFVPWFEDRGNFLQHLFQPHNEHRVVLTKLQNLALALLNGQWDSRLEAVTNALLHAAIAVAFWLTSRRWIAARWHGALFMLAFALFGLPLAWQNVLGGFHSQQYWLLGLSFAAIVTLPFAPSWSGRWWLGTLCAVLALGSMGSGFLAAAIVFAVIGWRLLRRDTSLRQAWPALLVTAILVAVGLATRVEVDYHQQLKAKTAHDFVFSILRSLEWPWRDHDWIGAMLWLPWLLVAWAALVRRAGLPPAPGGSETHPTAEPDPRPMQIITALGGWVLIQLVATAYARGAGADYPASRYMDTLTFGALVNGAALAWLLSTATRRTFATTLLSVFAVAWGLTLALGLRQLLERNLRNELPDAKKYYINAEGHMRRYLATNDPKQLAFPDIPFPSAPGLVERLAHPSLRALMPLPIRAPLTLTAIGSAEAAPGFLANNAIGADPEHPPRNGLSPATAPLDYALTWGSFGSGADGARPRGTWTSAPLPPPGSPWLKFETAGDVGRTPSAISLSLHDAATGVRLADIAPSKRAGDGWRAAYVRAPRVPFVVRASDESETAWLAFSPPVEMGALSFWAWQATKHGLLLVYLSTAATLACMVIGWRTRRTPRTKATPPP